VRSEPRARETEKRKAAGKSGKAKACPELLTFSFFAGQEDAEVYNGMVTTALFDLCLLPFDFLYPLLIWRAAPDSVRQAARFALQSVSTGRAQLMATKHRFDNGARAPPLILRGGCSDLREDCIMQNAED